MLLSYRQKAFAAAQIFIADTTLPDRTARASHSVLHDLGVAAASHSSSPVQIVLEQRILLLNDAHVHAVHFDLCRKTAHPEIVHAALGECAQDRTAWLCASIRAQLKRRIVLLPPHATHIHCSVLGRDVHASVTIVPAAPSFDGTTWNSAATTPENSQAALHKRSGDVHACFVDERAEHVVPLVDGKHARRVSEDSAAGGFGLIDMQEMCASAAQRLYREVVLPLQHEGTGKVFKSVYQPGVLLHGHACSGKASLARAAAKTAGLQMYEMDCNQLLAQSQTDALQSLQSVLRCSSKKANEASTSEKALLVLLRYVDTLASTSFGTSDNRFQQKSSALTAHASALLSALDCKGANVVVIATANQPDALERAMRRPGRLDCEIELTVPTKAERAAILHRCLQSTGASLPHATVQRLAATSRGCVAGDLASTVDIAALEALYEENDTLRLTEKHLRNAVQRVVPSSIGEATVEETGVTWDDIGGQETAKRAMQEALYLTLRTADTTSEQSSPHPGGLLLYGPPGCSKTLLAKAAASEAGLSMLSVKGPELYSRYVGDSEKAVKSLFRSAHAAAPSIVLLDELDGLAPPRSAELKGEEASGRVLAQLLSELDSGLAERGVFALAATNRPDMVDAALLRPGRFSRHLHIQPPATPHERLDILRVQTRSTPLADDVNAQVLQHVAEQTAGFTGADLSRLCVEAGMNSIARAGRSACTVQVQDIYAALASTTQTHVKQNHDTESVAAYS